MFSKCANPDCTTPFDYHQGRYFRFRNEHQESEPDVKTHSVQHFWLCEHCRATYTLHYEERRGVIIDDRSGELHPRRMPRVMAAA
jgi:hypothetical protein